MNLSWEAFHAGQLLSVQHPALDINLA